MKAINTKGTAVRIYPYGTEKYRKELLGTADYIQVTSRGSAYIELGNNIPTFLDGEIQLGFVIEKIEGFDPTQTTETGRSMRYNIEFIDEQGDMWQLFRCKIDTQFIHRAVVKKVISEMRVEGVAEDLYPIIVSK